MKTEVILHVPHSSLCLTEEFEQAKKELSEKEIREFNFAITDLYTEELFPTEKYETVKAEYSRICVDVEKFTDDSAETMSKWGMGCIYEKTNLGKKFFSPTEEYRKAVLEKYYFPHHRKLDNAVLEKMYGGNGLVLLDCHSFSSEIVMAEKPPFPDICIGTENGFCNERLIEFTKNFFESRGLTTELNYPYCGAMLPDCFLLGAPSDFSAIMIEINRRIYLDGHRKSKNFDAVRGIIEDFFSEAKRESWFTAKN